MNDVASSFASIWLTYLARSYAAYAVFWLLCRVIRDPRLRFQLCVVFLIAMVAGWLGSFVQPNPPVNAISGSVDGPTVSDFSRPLTLHVALSPRVAILLSGARWMYVASLTLLLLQFCRRFWKLRILLRDADPPAEALQAQFESLRSLLLASQCELLLVPGLPSPAAAGWWRPKVLLPQDLLSRLESQQLKYVLGHELIHVRRRDYLWDRMATLGCYLLFFHPAAWLVRRRLRWERELICDDAVVQDSAVHRLEYATCLTTVAAWRWRSEAQAGHSIELLSSTSLLAARVRALTSPPGANYSLRKKALLASLVCVALASVASIAPDVAVTGAWPVLRDSAVRVAPNQPVPVQKHKEPLWKTERKATQQRHKTGAPEIVATDHYSRLISLQQARSTPSTPSIPSTLSADVLSVLPVSNVEETQASVGPMKRWGFARRLGTWTIHNMKLGAAKLGVIHQKRQNKSAEGNPELTAENSINPR